MTAKRVRAGLTPPKKAQQLLDLYFLDARSHLLEVAAILDRIERAPGGAEALVDTRMVKLRDACNILCSNCSNRAKSFLRLFSEPAIENEE